MNQEEVIRCIEAREQERLVGLFESEWLECKMLPHTLDTDAGRYELAKDVSAMANQQGGLLLYGAVTAKDEVHSRDQITSIRPFPSNLFNETRLRQHLVNWTVPEITDLRIHTVVQDPNALVVLIEIAPAGPSWPVLVNRIIGENERETEVAVAFCERVQDKVKRTSPQQLQSLLRDGLRFTDEIRTGFEELRASLEDLGRRDAAQVAPSLASGRYPACRDLAANAAGLQTAPILALTCIPQPDADVTEIFSRRAPVVQLLEHPPELRNAGFNIQADPNSHIVNGESRRTISPNHNVLEVFRDGVVVYVVRGDDEGLCWPPGRYTPQRINPVFLIESTYLFIKFCEEVLLPKGDRAAHLRLELHRMASDDDGDRNVGPRTLLGQTIPSPGVVVDVDCTFGDSPSEGIAFKLVAELFRRFGIEDERIPLTRPQNGEREIDLDAIRNMRG